MADTAETYKGEFYCVKCKAKREAEGRVVETNGPSHGQGHLPGPAAPTSTASSARPDRSPVRLEGAPAGPAHEGRSSGNRGPDGRPLSCSCG